MEERPGRQTWRGARIELRFEGQTAHRGHGERRGAAHRAAEAMVPPETPPALWPMRASTEAAGMPVECRSFSAATKQPMSNGTLS